MPEGPQALETSAAPGGRAALDAQRSHRNPRALRWLLLAVLLMGAASAAWLEQQHLQHVRLAARLLASDPQSAARDPQLVRFAVAEAKPLYAEHCASCHGAKMQGNAVLGAPSLTNGHWLWGNGSVFQIERILLYGIRSGQSKALNTTDMPPYGLTGRLSDGQIHELVQYLLKLNHRPYDTEAANAGEALFHDDVYACMDCHGADAHGESDYGAPDLTANTWNNGGDAQSLYNSIYYGRHRIMPAWQHILSLEQIRALAVYIHTLQPASAPPMAQPEVPPAMQDANPPPY